MKIGLLIIILICCSWVIDSLQPVTESTVKDKKEQCKSEIDAYFYSYSFLLGTKISGEQKDVIIEEIQKKFFVDNTVRIESDDEQLHKKRYDSKEYHDVIAEMYGKINGTVKTDIKNLSEIYFDNNKGYYFVVANVDKEIIVDKNNDSTSITPGKKSLDIYFSFTLKDRKPKIFSIQNHKENALSNLSPVQVIPDNSTAGKLSETAPAFVFNVTPAEADIFVDGKPISYANGQKFETAAGSHKIEIRADNYNTEVMNVVVGEKSTYFLKKDLASKKGYLNVNAYTDADAGADIWINDIAVGNIPLKNYPLAVGSYKVKIKKDDHFKICRINISENRSTDLNASLGTDGYLRGIVSANFVYLNTPAVIVPSYHFSNPMYHTYRGQAARTSYSYRMQTIIRNSPQFNRSQYRSGIPRQPQRAATYQHSQSAYAQRGNQTQPGTRYQNKQATSGQRRQLSPQSRTHTQSTTHSRQQQTRHH